MNIREEISLYLQTHPIDRTQKDPYGEIAKLFGVSTEVVRCQWRKLRRKGIEKIDQVSIQHKVKSGPTEDKFSQTGDTAELSKTVYERIKTLEDLVRICEIDLAKWEITSWECNKWEVGIRTDDGEVKVEPLYQVKAKLKIRTLDNDLGLQKELILKELKEYSPHVKPFDLEPNTFGELLLELAVLDLHLGSLVWHEETGDNYDLKIAEKRFKDAISALLSRVNISTIGKIMIPIGNDFLNVDNKNNSTSNGTVVDTDCRFMKMVKAGRRILIETIDSLSRIAPVDVLIVPGNHDYTSSLMLGEILEAFYHNNERVHIDNSLKSRKYYKFGKVGIQLTHGDEEKHPELGLIFATEEPKMWGETKFRFCQLGHHHKNKKTNYISVNEFPGFQIQILPTLSSTTAWAYKKGYNSLKQAKAFLYHPTEGCIAEYTYTV